ncbi:calcium-binding protein [Mesorhizobium sp. IMUNJ 23232]|uniref:calcium-binding protein n=1 Tax=Mesorhizobium sp. IMUNJ 23232 TaxID=3376064 RepID=UPI0037A66AA0
MTTYLLTTGDDTITGTADADTFDGWIDGVEGGLDTLKGGGGDDRFILSSFDKGSTIDGGSGSDTYVWYNQPIDTAQFSNIEVLELNFSFSAEFAVSESRLAQIVDEFDTIIGSPLLGGTIVIELHGDGSSVDLSNSIGDGYSLRISGSFSNSGIHVTASKGDDIIYGSDFADVMNGSDGNDTISGFDSDVLNGGAGNDTLNSYFFPTSGGAVDGGEGNDTLFLVSASFGKATVKNVETLKFGNSTDDHLIGRIDTLSSFQSLILSKSVVDIFLEGTGGTIDFLGNIKSSTSITISGENLTSGYTAFGTSKSDSFVGSTFNDTFYGSLGADTMAGGEGLDKVDYSKSTSGVKVQLDSSGNYGGYAEGDDLQDIEIAIGSAFADTLQGSYDADRLFGGDGNDILFGGAGADYLSGGLGIDTVSYFDNFGWGGVRVNLADPSLNALEARGDTYSSIENLIGTDYRDYLSGNGGANSIEGGWSNDIVEGFAGNDKLSGGEHNDVLNGGLGADYLSGGLGSDTASYAQAAAAVKANLADPSLNAGEAKGDTFASIENLEGSAFNDTLDGNAGTNTLTGLGGIDVLRGAGGNDTLQGGDGEDKLGGGDGNDLLSGGAGADYLNGGNGTDTASYASAAAGVIVNLAAPAGNTGEAAGDTFISIENLEGSGFGDRLSGNSAANAISGLNGADVIDGGAGSDTLSGGAAKDFFVFSTALGASNIDTIADFSAADDTIRLDNAIFAALGANGALLSGYFRANTTGTAQDANDHIIYETDTGKLFYDADGNGVGIAIQFATLTGNPAISVADFQVI